MHDSSGIDQMWSVLLIPVADLLKPSLHSRLMAVNGVTRRSFGELCLWCCCCLGLC